MNKRGYKVSGIEHSDMVNMVTRRLSKLAMCKRGVLVDEKRAAKEACGKEPRITTKERALIDSVLTSKIKKALTPTAAMMKYHGTNIHSLLSAMQTKVEKIKKGIYTHPDREAWKAKCHAVDAEFEARNAELDSEFQDAQDQFVFGLSPIQEFTETLELLESKQW